MVNMPLIIYNFVSEIDETAHQSKVLRLYVQEERQRRGWTPVEIQVQNALNALIIPQILPWIRPIYDTNCHPPAENGWEPK